MDMKRKSVLIMALAAAVSVNAEKIYVKTFRYCGPYEVKVPVMLDSVNVNNKPFELKQLMNAATSRDTEGTAFSGTFAPSSDKSDALHSLQFEMENKVYEKAEVKVEGLKEYKVFVDGKEAKGENGYEPARHKVEIKYLTQKGEKTDSLKVGVETNHSAMTIIGGNNTGGRPYTLYDVLLGERYLTMDISPNGKYLIYSKRNTKEGGATSDEFFIKDLTSNKIIGRTNNLITWMPKTNKYWYIKQSNEGRQIINGDPVTQEENVFAEKIPDNIAAISPTEDYIIISTIQEGPKEDPNVYEVIEPDDRQPGWRNRSGLAKYDLKTGILQPLTYGYHNVGLCDISQDGKYLMIMKSESRLTQRPTTVMSIYRMNIETMALDTIVEKDGFLSDAKFTKDGKQIVIQGTPECLGGIGSNVKKGQTPSMTDLQLYLYDLGSRKAEPLTKHFNPCVQRVHLSASDGMMYFTAEDKDCVHLYQLDVNTKKIKQINTPEDVVTRISISSKTGNIAMYGQGASNSDRMYIIDTKTQQCKMIDDLSSERLKGVSLGDCKEWIYTNRKGDSIVCRYYLPADFDPSKKYPMIVNYYGGCSPTERLFENRYPQHAYAALGYVVLIINPHGATGFGQEWSAVHVNTAGKGPAEDIIESTKAFTKQHTWVNEKKIGCIGASYGGFMTQYLQTVTDIFAAAISHAGISDHTSYWGYGYWGYSYSEVSMANSYPWTRKDLFVDQSPLYRADKVNTPLLFVHGDADTNVPVNESIQMYTALKLLGKETAMVLIKDQNHHIKDYNKRIKWQNTIWAWFAKWLQDDDTWWESMYGKKAL